MRQTLTDRSAFKFVLLSCCAAFLCETGTPTAHAQTSAPAQVQVGDIAKTLKPEEAEKGAGTPTDGEEPPATSLSEEEEAMKPKAGNLFHVALLHNSVYWRDEAVIEFSVTRLAS